MQILDLWMSKLLYKQQTVKEEGKSRFDDELVHLRMLI